MFAIVALERTPISMAFKCTPENFAELMEREGYQMVAAKLPKKVRAGLGLK